MGGIAIYFAILLTLFWSQFGLLGEPVTNAVYISGGITLLVIVGVLDDWRGLSPLIRFAVQIAAALMMAVGSGVVLTDLGSCRWTVPCCISAPWQSRSPSSLR